MSHRYRIFGILVLVVASLLVTVSPAAAASATGKNFTLPAVTKTTYSIYGTVRANSTSALVPNVEVTASCTTCTSYSFTYGTATTNASGNYTITRLLPGSYTLRFDPPRTTNLQHGYRGGPGPAYFSDSTPAAVTITSASIYGANIRLPGGYEISGKVTRSNGTTVIANAPVSADGTYGSDDTETNSAGAYTLMGLSPGSYTVSFGHDPAADNQTGCWYATAASKFSASCVSHTAVVISSANVTGISPKIPNALKITGFVKTRAATPVPIADAYVYASGPEYGSAYTDATGKYTIGGLNPGSYTIKVDGPYDSNVPDGYYYATAPYYWTKTTALASSVTISAAVTTLAIIKPPTGYYIRGKITNTSGTPLDFVFVNAVGGAGTATEDPDSFTDASGNYSIGPLPFGNSYKIQADPSYSSDPSLESGWYLVSSPNNFTLASSSALTLTMTADKNGINMHLPKGASISGIVTIAGVGACSDCWIEAESLTGSMVADTNTSSSGAYKLQGLPAGSYKVYAYASSTVIDSTHVRLITSGYYKSGSTPNFSATLAGATPIAVSP
jgi:hypothetical protein